MNYVKYIEEITKLIEANINRIKSRNVLHNPQYFFSSKNFFELDENEYEKLSNVVEKIYSEGNFKNKVTKTFIFDKLVKEVIIPSYNLTSSTAEIKLNLKNNFEKFDETLNGEIKDWTYFIPISGIFVEGNLSFNSMAIYTFESFKNEILDYFEQNPKLKYERRYKERIDKLDDLKDLFFVKITVNGTKEISKDKSLNKVNELLSIFSLYKPYDTNGFGIMGEVLPLNSKIITYSINGDNLNISRETTVRNRFFNLTENLGHMENYYLDYFIELIHNDKLDYVEKMLLNSIQWYYESVKREFTLKEDVINETMDSNKYYEHYTYFKLGTTIINLVSSLESLLIFNNKTIKETKIDRFNLIMNYKTEKHCDYSTDLKELYHIRNEIAHNNEKEHNLLKINFNKYIFLINMFIVKFVEIKLDFDRHPKKFLKTKNDLNKFYNGKNRLI